VVEVEETLEPLRELEVVLVPGPGQELDLDVFADAALLEAGLEQFEIRQKLPLVASPPVDLAHPEFMREKHVKHLAIDSPSAQLLDPLQLQPQQPIQPAQDVPLRHEERPLHYPDARLVHLEYGLC
jgi:hypothetical protein